MIIQLHEPLSVETPLGDGYAVFVEAGGEDQWWTVLLSESRAFVTVRQSQIRGTRSYTHSRDMTHIEMRRAIRRKK